jgi:hypothetical protein
MAADIGSASSDRLLLFATSQFRRPGERASPKYDDPPDSADRPREVDCLFFEFGTDPDSDKMVYGMLGFDDAIGLR